MRSRLVSALAIIALAACGSAGGDTNTEEPDAGMPDAGGPLGIPPSGFQIVTPPVDIGAGVEITYCYYFRASNKSDLAIQKWQSRMTDGLQSMVVFLTNQDMKTPGTMSTDPCGLTESPAPEWAYAAQTPDAEFEMPGDDGHGTPVGRMIKAGQAGFVQMHYRNTTSDVLRAHIELNAHAYAAGTQVTPAGTYVTYKTSIEIGPGSVTSPTVKMYNGYCPVDANAKFFSVSTHTFKQAVRSFVKNGAPDAGAMVFESTDWEKPGAATFKAPAFFQFTSPNAMPPRLGYQCEYKNPNGYTIKSGETAARDELCMAIGHYFPAVSDGAHTGHYCVNDGGVIY